VRRAEELLGKVQEMGFEDAKIKSLKEVGVDLGRFCRHFWECDFLNGRKV